MYTRVVPRDLFNESKLLKCLGQLAILADKGEAPGIRTANSGDEFRIEQRQSDGGLYVCMGLQFYVKRLVLELYSAYNSKRNYPLICETGDGPIDVFEDDGKLTQEFCDYVAGI